MFHVICRRIHCTVVKEISYTDTLYKKNGIAQNWGKRQSKDPYVKSAVEMNYRCRSAFKLIEINDRSNILKAGDIVIDIGAAPGSWTQVAVERSNALGDRKGKPVGKVVAIDKQHFQPIQGATTILQDFTKPATKVEIERILQGQKADVVLSDMAPGPSGIKSLDHQVICKLATDAFQFAQSVLNEGGHFLCKIWQGADQKRLHAAIADTFQKVKVIKPSASRSESAEVFLLGHRYIGVKKEKEEKANKEVQ